jgi:hypothetical protein
MHAAHRNLLRNLVLSAISNDYEDIPTITSEVTGWAAEQGLHVTVGEILATLIELLQLGHAKAYRFIPPYNLPPEVVCLTQITEDNDCYFFITPYGQFANKPQPID